MSDKGGPSTDIRLTNRDGLKDIGRERLTTSTQVNWTLETNTSHVLNHNTM